MGVARMDGRAPIETRRSREKISKELKLDNLAELPAKNFNRTSNCNQFFGRFFMVLSELFCKFLKPKSFPVIVENCSDFQSEFLKFVHFSKPFFNF